MYQTASGIDRLDGSVYEGWNVGAVSVKRVRLHDDGAMEADIRRHTGDPEGTVRAMLEECGETPRGAIVTAPQAVSFLSLPFLPESICIEAALSHSGTRPDLVLSLGGESFVVYCMADGGVRRMISSNRCAAGSGEFLVQQFGRMNLDLASGMAAARQGRRVTLASRCSVHCKSDATHRLNKGECTPADIARSLIASLADKIAALIVSTGWPHAHIVLAGGLAQSDQLVEEISALLPGSRFEVPPESGYLEAAGAAVAARQAGARALAGKSATRGSRADEGVRPTGVDTSVDAARTSACATSEMRSSQRSKKLSCCDTEQGWQAEACPTLPRRLPLKRFLSSVIHIQEPEWTLPRTGMDCILGVDAGSTTTKAILLDRASGRVAARRYLRTHGNPVQAAFECIADLERQVAGLPYRIVQAAVTGSGREIVSIYLDNCTVFNEILAHARAAREVLPEVDTLFEIGGQDAKFVALEGGIPVDYAMNDGCSAGTGSFLEEAAASDMEVPIDQLGALALSSTSPIAFGERCAAFINSEVRAALQQGVPRADVLAGLVYAIVENYLSRVVGARQTGRTVLLQGGVALNPAVAPAVAALAGVQVTVPPNPELMGCEGAARMVGDLLSAGVVPAWDRSLSSFGKMRMESKAPFTCPACDNRCEVQRFLLGEKTLAFGGLCSKWEMARRPKTLRHAEGRDLVAVRHELMFGRFAPRATKHPRGRIGLPLALTTYELYPLYAQFLGGLGYEVVLSRPGRGSRRTSAPLCYPAELVHAAVDDLLAQAVDFVFLPYMREFPAGPSDVPGYLCPVTQDMPGVIAAFFETAAARILMPEMGLSPRLAAVTQQEVASLGARLGVSAGQSGEAWQVAMAHQAAFERTYRESIEEALSEITGPAVILVGRPYAAYAPEVNLSVPRKIATRGFSVIPGDALSLESRASQRNVWHYTQAVMAAVEYAQRHGDRYVCNISCFSCGPDAIIHHRLRRELEGQPFCFLEIDSHTAHAGIETRVGAFLDIIEDIIEARRRHVMPVTPAKRRVTPARLESDGTRASIVLGGITGSGRRVALDAPEVVHVSLADGPQFVSDVYAGFYASIGWRWKFLPNTDAEALQYAKRVCSGRECLPFLSMVGKAVKYLETRPPGEVTVFQLLDQEGPCQIGAWYDAAPIIFERLGEANAVVAWPTPKNNFLGQGNKLGAMKVAAYVLSDVVAEMRSALRCLATDRSAALALLGELETRLTAASHNGLWATERELRHGAQRLAGVPLRAPVEQSARVLLFGGLNRIFVDGPVKDFFEERGILTKTTEMSEFICFMQAEDIVRLGFSHGRLAPVDQCSMTALLSELISGADRPAAMRALSARIRIGFIEMLDRRWRRIAAGSGLLFSPYVAFSDVEREGHKRISMNGYTEAPMTVGRYATLLESGAFDGYVNIGAFNCAPANTASAVIHALSLRSDTPYAVIESDGDCITTGQLRHLEMVAVQCRRRREGLAQRLSA
jgi:predicted CoA-substrate-specific enzyme activase